MHKKHKARLSQFARNCKALLRTPLTETPFPNRSHYNFRLKHGIPSALIASIMRSRVHSGRSVSGARRHSTCNRHANVFGRHRNAQSWQWLKTSRSGWQHICGESRATRKILKLQSTNGRLDLSQSPVCSKRFMQPPKPVEHAHGGRPHRSSFRGPSKTTWRSTVPLSSWSPFLPRRPSS